MRSRNLAKIGQLVLDRGEWGGGRIVSAHWIDESVAAHIGAPDRLYFYGNQWWLGRSLVKGARSFGRQRQAKEVSACLSCPRWNLLPWSPRGVTASPCRATPCYLQSLRLTGSQAELTLWTEI
jgi:hypothetical protein